jgi:hypothetical protein
MILEVVGTGTDLRLGTDNDGPMMRRALNNARQRLCEVIPFKAVLTAMAGMQMEASVPRAF